MGGPGRGLMASVRRGSWSGGSRQGRRSADSSSTKEHPARASFRAGTSTAESVAGVRYEAEQRNSGPDLETLEIVEMAFEARGTALVPVGAPARSGPLVGEGPSDSPPERP